MSTHKHFDKICCIAIALCLVLTLIMMNAESFGVTAKATVMGYENKLFANDKVHTIDILMDDWDGFIATCENEEYVVASVVIDGEPFKNVAIRAKGNTSLSSVAAYGNDRYSFKIEFDHYDNTNTYYGLDKLSLNNIIQDNTYMKDYLVYTMMGEFGAAAPLCSYVYITVNGEDFGLYLAVEALEESFLVRNYGNNYGDLYKPDSMNMGGGRGNGKDFDMDEFMAEMDTEGEGSTGAETENGTSSGSSMFPSGGGMPNMGDFSGMGTMPNMGDLSEIPDMGNMGEIPDMGDFDISDIMGGNFGGMMGGGGFGMGSSETKLQYIDDDPDSYSTIFDSAKTTVTTADKERLIASLKSLSSYENLDEVLDMDAVIRYFVVHNFVCNGDSYTGSIIHNYYLYEEDGALSMLPWDYNLAFGGMSGGSATSAVNTPINSPVSGGTGEDRPMIGWIFSDEEYTTLYESYFDSFISEFFESGYVTDLINSTIEIIAPYVEKDPTKFCTYEEFELGSATLLAFCELRAESIRAQLDGTIGKTSETQEEATFVNADHINISDMGSMGGGMGGGRGDMPDRGDMGDFNKNDFSGTRPDKQQDDTTEGGAVASPASLQNLSGMPSMPDGFNGQLPEGFDGQLPEGFEGMSGQLPEGFEGMIPGASSTSSPNGGAEETTGSGQSGMTRPDNMGNFGGSFSGTSSGSTGSGGGTAILLLVSILALGVGLAVAFVFKGREI